VQNELFNLAEVEGYGVLTKKERDFVRAILEGASQRDAAKAAGMEGSENVLDAAASRKVRSVKVQKVLNQAWDRAGASIDLPLRQAAEMLCRAFAEWQRGATAEQREAARAEWQAAASYIASIHGKLKLKIEHDVRVHEVPVPEAALSSLAQMRRDVLMAGAS
jgi:hypothetical protein